MDDKGAPPTERPGLGEERETSLVLINTGDGKGKSTAAFGTAMRAVARSWKVAVVQFLKSGDWRVGEETIGRRLGIEWFALGDGFTWDSTDMDATEDAARDAWAFAKTLIESGDFDLIILDEITYPVNWEWIPVSDVAETIGERPERTNLVLTGRDALDELVDIADTVTEMRNVKHAFDRGVKARRGIDF